MRELIGLEKRCADLRATLGIEYRVYPALASQSAERAAQALVGEVATDFLSVHAADGTYLWASAACARLFGWDPESLLGRSAYDFFHPDDRARIAANHSQHVEGSSSDVVEYRFRTADGSYRWVETQSLSINPLGRLPGGARRGRAIPGGDADGDAWTPLVAYLEQLTERSITHGICPACVSKLEPG